MFRDERGAKEPLRKKSKFDKKLREFLVTMVGLINDFNVVDVNGLSENELLSILHGLDKERRIELILRVVATKRLDILRYLADPVEVGGFGWDVNVKALDGRTPLNVAAAQDDGVTATDLVLPPAAQGFGLPFDKLALAMFERNNPLLMRRETGVYFHKIKATRSDHYLSCVDQTTKLEEQYVQSISLGHGSHGSAFVFTSTSDSNKTVVVKFLKEKNTDEGAHSYGLYQYAKDSTREITMMNIAYPNQGIYRVKHILKPNSHRYCGLFVMPHFRGAQLRLILGYLGKPENYYYLLLAVTKELQRIHSLGVVHGDVKDNNILISWTSLDENKRPNFIVRFVDFGFAAKVGTPVDPFTTWVDYMPPERCALFETNPVAQTAGDVFSWGFTINELSVQFQKIFPTLSDELLKVDEVCHEFFEETNIFGPELRPTLESFIEKLTTELQKVDELRATSNNNKKLTK